MRLTSIAFVFASLIGCTHGVLDDGPPATFDTPADATAWTSASAPRLIFAVVLAYAAADANASLSGETCPAKAVSGTTTTFTGGCTDMKGRMWIGTASVVDEADRSGSYNYDGFGYTGPKECQGASYTTSLKVDGGMTMTSSGDVGTFDIDLEQEGTGVSDADCTTLHDTFAIQYTGTVRPTGVDANGDGDLDDDLYNGSGKVGSTLRGVASAKTENELISRATCQDEAASGTTTLEAGGHTMVIRYDGATDCDAESTVTWTYDGVDRGELSGVDCSAGRSGSASALLWIGAIVLAMRRRRRGATPR